jgi:hypothetical protein
MAATRLCSSGRAYHGAAMRSITRSELGYSYLREQSYRSPVRMQRPDVILRSRSTPERGLSPHVNDLLFEHGSA